MVLKYSPPPQIVNKDFKKFNSFSIGWDLDSFRDNFFLFLWYLQLLFGVIVMLENKSSK